ncbi:MAG: hypothetical protein LBI54_05670 [Lachnospiraceae bacterium]|jgi:hypothetical protein|nr:hypothetical protein [Lachnospiraceae bacterium]
MTMETLKSKVDEYLQTEDENKSDNDDFDYFDVFAKKEPTNLYKPLPCIDGVDRAYEGD